jgi:hypothetical protein
MADLETYMADGPLRVWDGGLMGWLLLGILSSLIQIGVMVGIVVLIVRFVSGKNKTTSESVGVLIRRLFVYMIMLAMLILLGIGVAGLIEAALPTTGQITDSSAEAARSIAFVFVGLPVYAGLAIYTSRRLRADPDEQRSFGWAFYLTVALIGSLLTSMALVGGILSDLASGDGPDRKEVIHAGIWIVIWIGHWVIAQRWEPKGAPVHLLLGSAAGLVWSFSGVIATLAAILSTVYEGLFLESVTGGGIDDLARPAMILVVGLAVWWWYWVRHGRNSQRTAWWHGYVLLLGVLGGAVTAISGAGIMLFAVLQWFLTNPDSSAAAHFSVLPGALAAVATGAAVWAYHRHILGDREDRVRTEVDRVYDYLLGAAGLVVAVSGVTTLIVVVMKQLFGGPVVTGSGGDVLSTAVTLLVIGTPLWWHYWSTIQSYRAENPEEELRSVTRRIYIVGLFGVAAVVAVISLIVLVFIFFEDILEGNLGSGTVDSAAVPIALLITAGALAWYHFTVLREDRSDFVSEIEDTPVVPEPPSARAVPRGSLEQTLETLAESGHNRTMVVRSKDGFEVEPIED